MLLYACNEMPVKTRPSLTGVEHAPTLDALLASMLAGLVQQRLRIGLGCNYLNQANSIRGIRGRIDFTESLKQQTFERGQAYCEFQQYDANVLKNRIIRSTLARLAQTGIFGPDRALADELRHRLRLLTRALDGIDLIELNLDLIRRQQFGRDDGDYRLMLAICELVYLRQMPSEKAGKLGVPTIDREALVLHRIYERFVANFYRIHLQGWTVRPQSRLSWHAKQDNPYLPSMQPDLILEEHATGKMLVLDTKFTAKNLIDNQWGKQIYDSSHLYQMYAYLRSQEGVSAQHSKATGILLYPAVDYNLSETVELEEHRIRIECVDLAAPWQEIERELLELVKDS
jgi:5-methylcytosine-specific restriction enzyme subunit McrC